MPLAHVFRDMDGGDKSPSCQGRTSESLIFHILVTINSINLLILQSLAPNPLCRAANKDWKREELFVTIKAGFEKDIWT
jgi:hypothetical protein